MAASESVPASEVKRSIPVLPLAPSELESVSVQLSENESIREVHIDGCTRLQLRYDASSIGFRDIEYILDQAGIQRPDSVLWRFKAALYRFLDDNARSNALSQGGACCNRPPPKQS